MTAFSFLDLPVLVLKIMMTNFNISDISVYVALTLSISDYIAYKMFFLALILSFYLLNFIFYNRFSSVLVSPRIPNKQCTLASWLKYHILSIVLHLPLSS